MNDSTGAVSVSVQLANPDGLAPISLEGHTVVLTATSSYQATTDADGKATFTDIVPDVYSISTSWKLTADEYAAATGTTVENRSYTVSGSLASLVLQASTADPVALATTATQDPTVVIGKVYYQGSKDDNNRNYVYARYLELYNNSPTDVDVAGLYIALMESASPTSDYPLQYLQDTVVAKQVFQIPSEQPFVVAPGGTVLIANSAVDHATKGAATEPDLLGADFEAKDLNSTRPHENNPATPALTLVYSYTNQTYMNLTQGGPCAVAIFQTDDDVATRWMDTHMTYRYGKQSGTQLMKIPVRCIVDAVEILKYNGETGADLNTKRLFDYLDAGCTYTEAKSGYDGRLVVRRTASRTDDGRAILQDTNNSTSDFVATDKLKPREYF